MPLCPHPPARPLGAPMETRGPRVCSRKGTLSGLELPVGGPGRWWVNLNNDAHCVAAPRVLSNGRSPTAEGEAESYREGTGPGWHHC